MKITHLIPALCFALLAVGCNEKKEPGSKLSDVKVVGIEDLDISEILSSGDKGFPEVKNISGFKQTAFLLTPENEIPANKNAVYCATMLLAWNQVRVTADAPITVDDKFQELKLLNDSEASMNMLGKGEYEAAVEINAGENNGVIRAVAKLKKELVFPIPFESYNDSLKFKGEKVASFGVFNPELEQKLQFNILSYESDNEFIIKLQPKDTLHEILLYMTEKHPKTMAAAFKDIVTKRKIADKRKSSRDNHSRYSFNDEDVIIIPKMLFNIQEDYESMIDNEFMIGDIKSYPYKIMQMTQRTAFKLDERGAELESRADLAAAAASFREKPTPKKMIFNKPFLVVLKRTDSPNPYFAMWVENTELMIKE